MSITISLVNQKGGVGKTTIATNLAAGLSRVEDSRVLLVDADVSQSATYWFARRETERTLPFTITQGPTAEIHKSLPQLAREGKYDFTLIDCPAGTSSVTRAAMLLSDMVVIPFQPSQQDIDASRVTVPLLQDILAVRPNLVLVGIINRRPTGRNNHGTVGRLMVEEFFKEADLPAFVLDTQIYQRNEVLNAYDRGLTVFEQERRSKSALEFSYLTKEIIECLNRMNSAAEPKASLRA